MMASTRIMGWYILHTNFKIRTRLKIIFDFIDKIFLDTFYGKGTLCITSINVSISKNKPC